MTKQRDKKSGAPKKEQSKPTNPQEEEWDDQESSDYGGLPDRDLKKNLGCG